MFSILGPSAKIMLSVGMSSSSTKYAAANQTSLVDVLTPTHDGPGGSWSHSASKGRETKMFGSVLSAPPLCSRADTITQAVWILSVEDSELLLTVIWALNFLYAGYQFRQ